MRKINRLYEYNNGKDIGWAVEADDGGTILVTIEKGSNTDVTGYDSEPRHPDIIGATLNNWYFYRRSNELDQKREQVLALDTSKGEVKLSVYRYGDMGLKLRAEICIYRGFRYEQRK